jgi:hypothetical protein
MAAQTRENCAIKIWGSSLHDKGPSASDEDSEAGLPDGICISYNFESLEVHLMFMRYVYYKVIWYIYFAAIWYILWPVGIINGHLVYFMTMCYVYIMAIWNMLCPFNICILWQ